MSTTRSRSRAAPAFVPPYSQSWLDHFVEWVDRLPGPAWILYLAVAALGSAIFVAIQWTQGVVPSGTTVPFHVFLGVQPVISVGMAHAVRTSSRRSAARFRPLLSDLPHAFADAEYRVMNSPARGTLLTSIFFALLLPPLMLGVLFPYSDMRLQSLGLSTASGAVLSTGLYIAVIAACLGGFAFHLVHQLRVIARLVGDVATLDLFRLEPVYAFSTTTALAAVLLTLNNYLWYATQPALLRDPFSIFMGVFAGFLALMAFAWPLWGVHQLLAKEKRQALAENGAAFKTLAASLHEQIRCGRMDEINQVNKAMASLELERASLSRIPTWPWHPETLRTILATIFLPIVLWLLQYFLGRMLAAKPGSAHTGCTYHRGIKLYPKIALPSYQMRLLCPYIVPRDLSKPIPVNKTRTEIKDLGSKTFRNVLTYDLKMLSGM